MTDPTLTTREIAPRHGFSKPTPAAAGWIRRSRRLLTNEPWRSAVLGAVLLAILAFAYWLVAPRTYRARAVVAPSSRQVTMNLPGALSGLAGQLGVGMRDATTAPAFYDLLGRSESLEREVLFSTLPPQRGQNTGRPVWQALGVAPCDSLCILRFGLTRLQSSVDIVVNDQTGTFEISAVLKNPFDAAGLVNLYIGAIDSFNRNVRRTQARASRQFLEDRVAAVTAQLHSAENDLQTFYERNTGWQGSPRLTFAEGRLKREVESRSELLSGLVRQLESARLDEVNSTPLLSVIDSATPPLRKYSPHGLPILLGALMAGGLLGLALGIARMRATS